MKTPCGTAVHGTTLIAEHAIRIALTRLPLTDSHHARKTHLTPCRSALHPLRTFEMQTPSLHSARSRPSGCICIGGGDKGKSNKICSVATRIEVIHEGGLLSGRLAKTPKCFNLHDGRVCAEIILRSH